MARESQPGPPDGTGIDYPVPCLDNSVMKPIPIAGYTALSAIGTTVEELEESLFTGRSGLSMETSVLPPVECPVGEVQHPVPPLPESVKAFESRCSRLLAVCLTQLTDTVAVLTERFGAGRVGVVMGTSASGNTDLEAAFMQDGATGFDYHHKQSFGTLAEMARHLTGVRGPAYSVSTACSSGANAVISSANLIGAGVCDAVIVGSSDALCLTTYQGFRSLQVMDDRPCRPFDVGRQGLNLGEGAAVLLLSRERLDPSDGDGGLFLAGTGASSEAYHMTAPDPEGMGATKAMNAALSGAGIEPDDLGYLNLHGTGTPLNDVAESKAVERIFGTGLPCSSTKGYTGHLLGSAAGVEAVIALAALRSGRLPRNINLERMDPDVAIRILAEDEEAPGLRYVLSNSFAFGGNDTSLVFGREP